MNQLAVDGGASFPLAVPVIKRQIYVDDFIFGADDKRLARQTREQVVSLLKQGGFTLHKWASNSPELLDDIDPTNHGLAQSRELCEDDSLKILGLTWNPNRDVFQFRVDKSVDQGETKRQILSNIAKLFDPLDGRFRSSKIIILTSVSFLHNPKIYFFTPFYDIICLSCNFEICTFLFSFTLLDRVLPPFPCN